MTDKVQKIREEVERLQNELIQEKRNGFGSDVDDACILELQNVLTYIDSLQEEHISDDLGEATNNYCVNVRKGYPRVKDETDIFICNAFKAGAEWGRNQAMAEIQAQSMALAHGCPKEPVNKELVETVKSYVETHVFGTEKFTCQVATDMFISGAQWQKQKTVDKACKWIDENAAKYLVDRFVGSTRVVGIDTSITEDFRKDMED